MSRLSISIEEEMKTSYLDYAMSVIIGRALPDVKDGLKPVQRRILYAMFKEGLLSNKKYSKCAGVVGEVLKKYHPHGDTAVYDALVRMAQDFNMRYPLVDGQGNFGSIDGDPPAAYRYTEARLAKIAEDLLADIDKDTVNFTANFDETTEEPVVLPTRIPNLLINGSDGIAVGMATKIPPHNLAEVIDGLVMLLDNPSSEITDLMKVIKGPDFPTGAEIHGTAGIADAYTTGKGSIKLRAKVTIEREASGKESIIITELPYQVNKARLIEKIAELIKDKKIEGITDLRDESDRDGIRVVIELKKGEIAQIILNNLYKHTQMSISYGVIMLALVNGQPHIMNLKEMLQHFLDHRREVTIRKTRFELKKAEERAHILEGLKTAIEDLDAIIELIRSAKSPEEAKSALMSNYPLSAIQAQAILDMRLQRLTGLERDKIISDYKDTLAEIQRLKEILQNEEVLIKLIRDDLIQIKQKYSDERRSEIKPELAEFSIEDLVTDEDMVVTISHFGYIKRTPASIFKSQKRGGKGLTGMETRDDDYVEQLIIGSNHDYMLFFSNKGKLYWLKVYDIPEAARASKGKAIVNLLPLSEDEKITTAINVKDFSQGFLMMFTKKGIVKKTELSQYSNPRSKGIIAITLDEGDELITVQRTSGNDDIVIGTRSGQAARFKEQEVRPVGRSARGVIGIRLEEGDEVVAGIVAQEGTTLLTVTEKGLGKRTDISEYPVHGRGGKGVISIKVVEKGGSAVGMLQVKDEDSIMLITNTGKLIRTVASDISLLGRNTQGVKLMDLTDEDKIVSIGKIVEE